MLDKYTKEGGWVFLDNVHLMQGWIPSLERKLEIAAETAHPDFRCFFSAEPINGAPQVCSFAVMAMSYSAILPEHAALGSTNQPMLACLVFQMLVGHGPWKVGRAFVQMR